MKSNLITWNSLKTRVTLISLVVFVVSIWSLLFYFSRVIQKNLQHELGEQQFSTVTIVASEINHEVVLRFDSLKKVSEKITPAILNNASKLQTLLEDRPILDILFNGGYFVALADGTTIADFPVSMGRIGTNFSERGWMIDALKGKATIGTPVIGKKLQVPVFTMAAPIRDSGGKVIGVLGGVTDLSKPNFLDRVVDNKYGKTGGFLLVAPQHKLIVTATDKKRIMQPIPAPGVNPLFDRYKEGFEGFGRAVNSLGFEELTASKQIPAAGWYIIVKTPITEAFAPFYNTQQHFIVSTIILTLLVGCVIWWVLKHHLSPIFTTVNTLTRMSEGSQVADLLPVARHDELGLLISGFNTLLKSKAEQEESLKLSEQRFRKAIEEAPFPIMIHAEDGEVLALSRTWTELSGYTLADIPTIAIWTEKAYGINMELVIEEINTLYSLEHRKSEGEYTVNCHDGTKRIWDFSSVAISFLSDGRRTAMSMASDVTERKHAEIELWERTEDLKESQRIAHVGSWRLDITSNQVVWSEELYGMYGYDAKLPVPPLNESQKLFTPESWQRLSTAIKNSINTGSPYNLELEMKQINGSSGWMWAYGKPIIDGNGTTVGLRGIAQDITDRKRSEEVLRQSEATFRAVAELSPMAIYASSGSEQKAKYINAAFSTTFGYSMEDVPTVGHWWIKAYPDEKYRQQVIDQWVYNIEQANRNNTDVAALESVCTCKDSSEKIIVWVGKTIGDDFWAFGYDYTDHKKAEEEKHALEQQFQQTQKLESLGVLAGGIAHDFNNILAIIMGYCSLTKLDYESSEKHIPEIEKAAERAAALCRQMLAYAGKASLTQTQVNTRMLVDEMVTMLKTTIQKNVVINAILGLDIPTITGDASQIRQVVMNLIINAAEAIGDAEGEIHVSLAKTEIRLEQPEKDHLGIFIPAGRYIYFEVTDNGCGMDEDTRHKIFEPFYTTKFTGRGLGMSAVLGIIKAHNGALQLVSQPGQGTTFKVYLPVQLSKSETEDVLQKSASAPWQGSGTILLVEDEEQVRAIATAAIKKLGFTVIAAANGKEALELYQQNATDITLVVTDMGMPVMNGYELFYKLKQLNPQLPIIVSSGFGEGDIGSKIPRAEIAGLINKPYSFEHLREVLKGVVEGAK